MPKYPYIQREWCGPKAKCTDCSCEGPFIGLEWRVDIFQGNCEIERLCKNCADKKGIVFKIK